MLTIKSMEVSMTKNESNSCSISELNYVRDSIEAMNKFNQIEVLRILNDSSSVMLNENKNGVHINLSELTKELISELNAYITYVNTQEVTLYRVEQQKENFKNIYFTKDNKDNVK